MPHVGDPQMSFRMVTNALVHEAGRGGVSVDWNDPVWGTIKPWLEREEEPSQKKTILSD